MMIFRAAVGHRKPAEELFEGMLIKSKNQYEEAKVEFFSNLYANGCVDTTLSPQMISLFILILDRLSFNHLDVLNRFKNWGKNRYGNLMMFMTYKKKIRFYLLVLKNLKT